MTAARSQSLGAVFARGLPIKFLWCHLEEYIISKNIHPLGQCNLIAMKDNSMIAFLFIICFFLRDEFYCFTTPSYAIICSPVHEQHFDRSSGRRNLRAMIRLKSVSTLSDEPETQQLIMGFRAEHPFGCHWPVEFRWIWSWTLILAVTFVRFARFAESGRCAKSPSSSWIWNCAGLN